MLEGPTRCTDLRLSHLSGTWRVSIGWVGGCIELVPAHLSITAQASLVDETKYSSRVVWNTSPLTNLASDAITKPAYNSQHHHSIEYRKSPPSAQTYMHYCH